MTDSGFYPAGAEHDPRAPYNQPDLPECVSCEAVIDSNASYACDKHGTPVCGGCSCPSCVLILADEPEDGPDDPED